MKLFGSNKGNDVRRFEEKRRLMGYETFLIGYIVLIILPCMILSSGKYAWMNITLAVILVALVLWAYFDKTFVTSTSWGMRAIYTSLQSERYYMNYQRTHFWRDVDVLLSYDIRDFLEDKIRELAVMGKLGSKMRILLLDPQSPYVEIMEKASNMKPGEYAYYVLQIQNFMLRVNQAATEDSIVDITIKYYDDLPLDNMFRAYDVMFAYDNKQCSEENFMSYSFDGNLNGYNFYRVFFEEKWNDESFCYSKEITGDMVPNYRVFADNDTISYRI